MDRWPLHIAVCWAVVGSGWTEPAPAFAAEPLRVATFRCEVTPPLGQPLFAGDALETIEQPLLAKGIVLEAGKERYVLCAFDWCVLSNGSYQSIVRRLAEAVGTSAARVSVHTVHQHTAPYIDAGAQKLLAEIGAAELMVRPEFLADVERRLAAAASAAVRQLETFDRVGAGQAKVERVASERRVRNAAGDIPVRTSYTADPAVRNLPEGKIDPWLKTVTLARGDRPLVRLHYYATHPQTRYRDGRASSDIVGDAREELERKEHVFQVYFTGCGGDITVGKYNDGSPADRKALAGRLLAGMEAAVAASRFVPVDQLQWRTCPLLLPLRTDPAFRRETSAARMKDLQASSVARSYQGAGRLVYLQRADEPIILSCLQFGDVFILNLPGEPMLEFQTFAQGLQPRGFVAVAGYGDGGPGYLCPQRAFSEGGYEPTESLVAPESEDVLKKAITALLAAK